VHVLLPRAPAHAARRRSADALPRLRLSTSSEPARGRARLVRLVASVASGLLLAASFPPLDLGPLALVALVPLLWAWRGASPRGAALWGLAFGLAFFGVVLEWSRYFGAVAIAPLVIGEAAFIAGAGAIVAMLARRGIRGPWVVAVVWVVIEALRARFPFGGLAWGEVGTSLHDLAPARALASVGGVPLVSFVVLAVNGLLLDLAVGARARAWRSARWAAVGLGAMVAVTLVADVTRFEPEPVGPLRFALLQGNDQNRELTATEIAGDYLTRRHLDLAEKLEGEYDLIVFPESALERDPEQDPALRTRLVSLARTHDAVVLVNARHGLPDGELANANLAYDEDGRLLGVYAKQHLVPFGEYVPFRDQLDWIGELRQVPYDFEAGDHRVLFRVGKSRIGTVICFESAFGPLVRGYVRDGANVILVSTNNRSYRRSGLAAQHLAASQMRAAETGRPVLHASISGITGVVDADGDVHDTSELFVNKVTTGEIEATTGETLYVRLGNWMIVLSCAALVVLAAWSVWRRRAAVDSTG
jgi:apolipoprotein N-acyltransferase